MGNNSGLTGLNLRESNAYQQDEVRSLKDRLRLLETREWPFLSKFDMDAKGDLLAGSGSDTFVRLAVGANGYLLVADSTQASGLIWSAPSGTLLSDASVTNAKLADMAQATVKGRASGAGTGAPTDLTATQLNAIWGSADAFNASNVVTLGVGSDEGRGQMGAPPLKIKGNVTLIYRESADSQPPIWEFLKRRSGTGTVLQSGDILGSLVWTGADTTTFGAVGARINAEVDGTPGSADMPGRIVFFTSADGTASPVESFRVNSSQNVVFANGKTISIDQVGALDSDGLKLLDDGGNYGLFVEDGGHVGVGHASPTVQLHVSTTDASLVTFQRTGGTAPGTLDFLRSTNAYGTGLTGSLIASSDNLLLNVGAGSSIVLAINGTEALQIDSSSNATMVNGTYLATDEVRARDSGGLALRDDGGNYGLFVEDGGYIGIGHASPDYLVDIDAGVTSTGINLEISGSRASADIALEIYNYAAADTANACTFSFGLQSSSTKRTAFNFKSSFSTVTDGSRTALVELQAADNGTLATRLSIAGKKVGIGTSSQDGMLGIDQASTTGAIPVLELDQADLSEEFINFIATIGTGNPIEAVGAKTLTTTHFVRIQINGVGYRYLPVGTIA